jgi:hypothetical protein
MSANGQADPETSDRRRRLVIVGLIVLALLVFGVGYAVGRGGDGESAEPSATPAVTAATSSETLIPSPSHAGADDGSESSSATLAPSPEPDVLGDGRYFVRLTDVQGADEGPLQLQYDLASFLTGEEANQAAADRGLETPVPNDYLIVNDNKKLRVTPLSGAYGVKYIPEGNCCDLVKAHESQFLGWMGASVQTDFPPKDTSWWWITIDDGEVTKIAQQYLP